VSAVAEKLNEILADEWACVRVLRRSESQCDDPGKREVIKRIHKNCSVNCVSLANVIRALGGRPTDIPSPRFSLKLSDESLTDTLDMAQSAQQHIVDEIAAVLDEPDLKSGRSALVTVQQLHKEGIRWLKSAMDVKGELRNEKM
jgi:bacterioferritin (cytochrome b1)